MLSKGTIESIIILQGIGSVRSWLLCTANVSSEIWQVDSSESDIEGRHSRREGSTCQEGTRSVWDLKEKQLGAQLGRVQDRLIPEGWVYLVMSPVDQDVT